MKERHWKKCRSTRSKRKKQNKNKEKKNKNKLKKIVHNEK